MSIASHTGKSSESLDIKQYDVAAPRASALIESLRAFGYNIQTAIADLIDNSISAEAKNVWLQFEWNGSDSWIAITDDGLGMNEEELLAAMRPGSCSPLEERHPKDLGRFGLGLKTASFSQCRRLTVSSRTDKKPVVTRCWDLDYVKQTEDWRLLHTAAKGSESRFKQLQEQDSSGTVVLWECMDRIVGQVDADDRKAQDIFLETVDTVEQHLAMVFHRFLEKRDRLQIWINSRRVEAWDPFLQNEKATQQLPEEPFYLDDLELKVQPYILPHHSKIDAEMHDKAAGPKGWNAQQGFYIYRNKRLLVAGDWLSLFQKEEHCKLARIRIDLPNTMDDAWNIDVKKSRARPPAFLRVELKRIGRLTRRKATAIYRHRGKVIARENTNHQVFPWQKKIRRGKTFYAVNEQHPLVQTALDLPQEYQSVVRSLLRLLEETIPVQQIWLDSSTEPDGHSQPFEGVKTKEVKALLQQVYQSLRNKSLSPQQARDQLLIMEPFQHLESLIQTLSDQPNEEL